MEMTPLCLLGKHYGTDKYHPHCYTPVYHAAFAGRELCVDQVLEIGIKDGRSLRMWRDYFPNAAIHGIDCNPRWLINEDRIASYQADQSNPNSIADVARKIGGRFDLIVDDGSHKYQHQISSALVLLPYLTEDGLYVIEDIIQDAKGGGDDPHNICGQMPWYCDVQLKRTVTPDQNSDVMILIRRRKP